MYSLRPIKFLFYSVCFSALLMCRLFASPLTYCLIVMLYVRMPTSSPLAVWNPCKINKALKDLLHYLFSRCFPKLSYA